MYLKKDQKAPEFLLPDYNNNMVSLNDFKGSNIISKTNLAKISIIGTGMQDSPGYATKMFKSLATNNINIDMITTSEIRITCIIKESDLKLAAQSLHSEFKLDRDIT